MLHLLLHRRADILPRVTYCVNTSCHQHERILKLPRNMYLTIGCICCYIHGRISNRTVRTAWIPALMNMRTYWNCQQIYIRIRVSLMGGYSSERYVYVQRGHPHVTSPVVLHSYFQHMKYLQSVWTILHFPLSNKWKALLWLNWVFNFRRSTDEIPLSSFGSRRLLKIYENVCMRF
jgi:hypothetical protein